MVDKSVCLLHEKEADKNITCPFHTANSDEPTFHQWVDAIAEYRIPTTSLGNDLQYKRAGLLQPDPSEIPNLLFPTVLTWTCIQAFDWLLREHYIDDVVGFFRHYHALGWNPEVLFFRDMVFSTDDLADEERRIVPWLVRATENWQYSLLTLAKLRKYGEVAVLNTLPSLFISDFQFSLAQPWIRQLLASLYERGEEKKFHHAFFGTRKRGQRSFGLVRENAWRNYRIHSKMTQLLEQQIGHNRALGQVQASLQELGIKDHLSISAIKKIYREYSPETDPLAKLFSFHAEERGR